MFRHLGIRGKVLAVLALPVLVLAVASGAVTLDARAEVSRARQAHAVSSSAEQLGHLVAALQAERLASVQADAGDAAARARLYDLRTTTDLARGAVYQEFAAWFQQSLPDQTRSAVLESTAALNRLAGIRQALDAGTLDEKTLTQAYSHIVETLVNLPGTVAETLVDRSTAAGLDSVGWLGRAVEALSREQLAGLRLIAASPSPASVGSLGPAGAEGVAGQIAELAAADAQRLEALDRVRAVTGPAQLAAVRVAMAVPHGATASVDSLAVRLQGSALAASGSGAPAVQSVTWQRLTTTQAGRLRLVGSEAAAEAAAASARAVDDARLRGELTLAVAVLLVGLSVLMALIQSRRITAPLRRLTDVATGLAAELPSLVERAQAGGTAPEPPTAVVTDRDEVGRLAEAFREVHATTIVVAHQQAALRATIADMFVNVARRNQVLLSRLLSSIDRLERGEEDPDVLENLFRLDHLATRMRRNAESLLVLAGAESGRRLRAAMPLGDVLRTAVSEIEHYKRVRLALTVDPPIVGHLALPAAHLFAELIENATNFSDPGCPVRIANCPTASGVRVTITDEGMGLPADELAAINARLAEPGTVDAMTTQRLGFFVVGRLAARLDSRVQLSRGDERGTVVTVELSPALFLPGSLPGSLPNIADVDGEHQPVASVVPVLPVETPAPVLAEPVSVEAVPAGPLTVASTVETECRELRPLEPPDPALFLVARSGMAGSEAVAESPESGVPESGVPESGVPESAAADDTEPPTGIESGDCARTPVEAGSGDNSGTTAALSAGNEGDESAEGDVDGYLQPELTAALGPAESVPFLTGANEDDPGIAEPLPTPDWRDLLHQRGPRLRQSPVADPLSLAVWLTDDAWSDATLPSAESAALEAELDGEPAAMPSTPSPGAALQWQPDEEPVREPVTPEDQESVAGHVAAGYPRPKPQLPRRTPPLPPIPEGNTALPLLRRTPPSTLSGASALLSNVDLPVVPAPRRADWPPPTTPPVTVTGVGEWLGSPAPVAAPQSGIGPDGSDPDGGTGLDGAGQSNIGQSALISEPAPRHRATAQTFAAALQAPTDPQAVSDSLSRESLTGWPEPDSPLLGSRGSPAVPSSLPGQIGDGEPGSAATPAPVATPSGSVLRDVLPRHGFRIGLRFGRRSRGSGAASTSRSAAGGRSTRVDGAEPPQLGRNRPAGAWDGAGGPERNPAAAGDGGAPARGQLAAGGSGAGGVPAPGSLGSPWRAPASGRHGHGPVRPGGPAADDRGIGVGPLPAGAGGGSGSPGALPGASLAGFRSETGGVTGSPGAPGADTPGGGAVGPAGASGVGAGQPGGVAAPSTPPGPASGADEKAGSHLRPDPVEEERLRHAIASEALSELSRLSSYSPDRVSSGSAVRLVRRTPAATLAAAPSESVGDTLTGPERPLAETSATTETSALAETSALTETPAPTETPAKSQVPVAVPQAPSVPVPVAASGHPVAAGRTRDAEELRRRLSGFQAGVRRGRTDPVPSPAPAAPDPRVTGRASPDPGGTDRAGTDRAGTDRAGTDRAGTDRADTDEWRATP